MELEIKGLIGSDSGEYGGFFNNRVNLSKDELKTIKGKEENLFRRIL